jgi:5-methylcytosine-specific restriction endonuclease McrA
VLDTPFITFLGYDIHTFKSDRVRKVQNPHGKTNRRTNQGYISLHIPKVKMQQFMKSHGAGTLEDSRRTQARACLQNTSDYEIITQYNVEIRGFCHYYALAHRAKYHLQHLVGAWHFSLVKTLAGKHHSTMLKIVKKYKVGNEGGIALAYPTPHGPRVLREFKLADWKPKPVGYEDVDSVKTHHLGRVDTLDRLNAGICEYCGVAESLEVHHIHKMKDVKNGKEPWQILMAARQRKTMVLCQDCHRKLHQGTLPSPTNPTALRLMESGTP